MHIKGQTLYIGARSKINRRNGVSDLDHSITTPLLEVSHISKRYGKNIALKDVNFTLKKGEVHALLGGNGAGKSTLISIIGGAIQPDAGSMKIEGNDIQFSSPRDSLGKGIAVVYQELSVLPHLSVAENISMGNNRSINKGFYKWKNAKTEAVHVLTLLGGPAKEIDPDCLVSSLRTDQRQLVEIARAVNLGAKVILLDEPTSSLNHDETQHLFHVVRELSQQGIGFIFVSHRLTEIREISDRISVIRDGITVLNGEALSNINDSQLITEMLGRAFSVESAESFKKNHKQENKEYFKIVYKKRPETPISLNKGEIIGIAGLSGSGRSALLRHIWGDQVRDDMELYLDGKPYRPTNPKGSIDHGLAYIGEDRKETGLFFNLPLSETLLSPNRTYQPSLLVSKKEDSLTMDLIERLKVKTPTPDAYPSSLSGGNQQKLLFGRWLLTNPTLLLLDEPTRGVDVSTKFEIYNLIHQLTEKGATVLVVSSEVSELVILANRIVVLNKGLPVTVLTDHEIAEGSILEAMSNIS
jgi:ABC-type sugar transport system ATPase subunit